MLTRNWNCYLEHSPQSSFCHDYNDYSHVFNFNFLVFNFKRILRSHSIEVVNLCYFMLEKRILGCLYHSMSHVIMYGKGIWVPFELYIGTASIWVESSYTCWQTKSLCFAKSVTQINKMKILTLTLITVSQAFKLYFKYSNTLIIASKSLTLFLASLAYSSFMRFFSSIVINTT